MQNSRKYFSEGSETGFLTERLRYSEQMRPKTRFLQSVGAQKPGFYDNISFPPADVAKNPVSSVAV